MVSQGCASSEGSRGRCLFLPQLLVAPGVLDVWLHPPTSASVIIGLLPVTLRPNFPLLRTPALSHYGPTLLQPHLNSVMTWVPRPHSEVLGIRTLTFWWGGPNFACKRPPSGPSKLMSFPRAKHSQFRPQVLIVPAPGPSSESHLNINSKVPHLSI